MEFLRVAFCRIVNRPECRDSSQIVCESAGLRAERMTHDCGCRESQECREEFEKWTLRFQNFIPDTTIQTCCALSSADGHVRRKDLFKRRFRSVPRYKERNCQQQTNHAAGDKSSR
ncbi:hypothetical protein OUZ56_007528 [Daphnia magna]|uniref:GDNF/GAS1 domain-containing protein n=1 Tax=Daphnia magna TaxID=35525 RepID=A0ABR0AA82_9CRUS|nr:hypothetical protein OUZ56_007528 [Daphnia magna]